MKFFAKRLKDLRIENKLKQEELAEAVGVSASMISMWENEINIPSLEKASKLADIFKVSLDYLAGRTEY